MGRTSLAPERRAQVLNAFSRCVARAGIAGTSLENVAEEAGLARGHVRHYLGNRHAQVVALAEWISTTDQTEFAKVNEAEDGAPRLDAVMHYLFDPSFYEPGDELTVYLALFEEARRDDILRKMFLRQYHDILRTTSRAMSTAHSGLSDTDAKDIAYLLLCAAVGNAHLSQMGMSQTRARRLGKLCRKALAMLTPADRD